MEIVQNTGNFGPSEKYGQNKTLWVKIKRRETPCYSVKKLNLFDIFFGFSRNYKLNIFILKNLTQPDKDGSYRLVGSWPLIGKDGDGWEEYTNEWNPYPVYRHENQERDQNCSTRLWRVGSIFLEKPSVLKSY